MAWDGVIGMARRVFLSREGGVDSRYEEEDQLRSLIHACIHARGGDVSARARTVELGAIYLNLSPTGRDLFHHILAHEFDIDRQLLGRRIADLEKAQSQKDTITAEIALQGALSPPRKILLKQFSSLPNGLKLLIEMRAALKAKAKKDPRIHKLAVDIKDILASWFDVGLLDLQEITWNSPAALLEKLIEYEAMHEIRSWNDMRKRLDSNRLCFAFFYNKMPSEPLIFVEIALTNKLSDNIQELLNRKDEAINPSNADTAIFYSISNTQAGLEGINLGNFLIKTVVQKFSGELEGLKHFATLSPIPGFREWLSRKLSSGDDYALRPDEVERVKRKFGSEDAVQQLRTILNSDWYNDPGTTETLKPILLRLCAHYLLEERKNDRARDPVANFHLSNGAMMERINWLADLSENGKKRSFGLMVNYHYKLSDIDRNHEEYKSRTKIIASRAVRSLLS